jgi:hypothetical protein
VTTGFPGPHIAAEGGKSEALADACSVVQLSGAGALNAKAKNAATPRKTKATR